MRKYLHKVLLGLFVLGFVVIAVIGAAIALPKYRQVCGLAEEKARIQRRIDEKRAEIAAIKAKQRRFNTDREFVETLARQNRRVYPGELVFVFED